ncbi:MAG: kelch repeat-containing protein [Terracidiphilus sp.]
MTGYRLLSAFLLGCLIANIACSPSAYAQASNANEWTWMGGSNTVSSSGYEPTVYGTLGTPSTANTPGSRSGVVNWTDKSGHLWLFGGETSVVSGVINAPNDLWKFDTSTNEWTWMGGGGTNACVVNECGQAGVYGTLGTFAAGNFPGSRSGAVAWSDKSGHLWLYGGDGFDANGVVGVLNDMWEFDPSTDQWAWMGGSNTVPSANSGQPGVYGTKGTPAAGNNPGGRWMSSGWTDNKGNFWLFAGWGYDANGLNGSPNNLWEFNPSTNEWTWVSGSSTITAGGFQPGIYGTLGTPSSGNIPGSRANALTWSDSSGNLWLYGGNGLDADSNSGYLADLWEFNSSTSEWTWVNGSNQLNCSGIGQGYCFQPVVYGALGTTATGSTPGSRSSAASWTDSDGNFWLFGGWGFASAGISELNDLWEFHPSINEWEWMGGGSGGNGVYGTLGTPASGNLPGERQGAASWTDDSGYFWLYGGGGLASNNTVGAPNDLWKYAPSNTVNLPHADFAFSIDAQSFTLLPARSATTFVRITGLEGFNSSVTFSCSGLPTGASCSFSPSTITPIITGVEYDGGMTVTTAATTATLHRNSNPLLPGTAVFALVFCIGWKKQRFLQMLLLLVVSIAGLGAVSGCGGGSSAAQPTTSTVTVTATSGSLSHTATFSLTVN